MKLRPKAPSAARTKKDAKPRTPKSGPCPCCKRDALFCWSCACGFSICQTCMQEEAWGFTCNHITWICPDCGTTRSF